jgi:hypothetical protein
VDVSFPPQYPRGTPAVFTFIGPNQLFSLRKEVLPRLEKEVTELAHALAEENSVCLIACVEAIVSTIDGLLHGGGGGEGQLPSPDLDDLLRRRRSGGGVGAGGEGGGSGKQQRVGTTPCPVLSAGLFSGPGLFVTFNNGLVVARRAGQPRHGGRTAQPAAAAAAAAPHSPSAGQHLRPSSPGLPQLGRSSPPSPVSPRPQSPLLPEPTVMDAGLGAAAAAGMSSVVGAGGGAPQRQLSESRIAKVLSAKTYQHLLLQLDGYGGAASAPNLAAHLGVGEPSISILEAVHFD